MTGYDEPDPLYRGYRFSAEIIAHTVYFSFPLACEWSKPCWLLVGSCLASEDPAVGGEISPAILAPSRQRRIRCPFPLPVERGVRPDHEKLSQVPVAHFGERAQHWFTAGRVLCGDEAQPSCELQATLKQRGIRDAGRKTGCDWDLFRERSQAGC